VYYKGKSLSYLGKFLRRIPLSKSPESAESSNEAIIKQVKKYPFNRQPPLPKLLGLQANGS
jgi:hypothetical protein